MLDWGGVRTYVHVTTGTTYGSPVSQSCFHPEHEKRASDSLTLSFHLPLLFRTRKKLTQEIVLVFVFPLSHPLT